MPSRFGYYGGAILILIGMFGPIGWMVLHLMKFDNSTQRVIVPGTHQLPLDSPGTYSIYYEYAGSMNGLTWTHDEEVPPLTCTIRREAFDAQPLPLRTPTGRSTYTMGGNSGIRIYTFEVPASGNYILDVKATTPTTVSPIVLAIAPGGSGELIILILGSVVISTLTTLPGAAWIFITFRRQQQYRMGKASTNGTGQA